MTRDQGYLQAASLQDLAVFPQNTKSASKQAGFQKSKIKKKTPASDAGSSIHASREFYLPKGNNGGFVLLV
jgi:hypothetical protein